MAIKLCIKRQYSGSGDIFYRALNQHMGVQDLHLGLHICSAFTFIFKNYMYSLPLSFLHLFASVWLVLAKKTSQSKPRVIRADCLCDQKIVSCIIWLLSVDHWLQ